VLQQAGNPAAESVSAKVETPGKSNARRAAVAASLRMALRNWIHLLVKHNPIQPLLTTAEKSNGLVGQPLLAVRVGLRDPLLDSQEWLSYVALPVLTYSASPANMRDMAHSFLIFDFGGNEDAAQQARHRIDGWKQGFRLDKKLQVKFERKNPEATPGATGPAPAPPKAAKSGAKGKAKPGAKSKSKGEAAAEGDSAPADPAQIRLIVRLDFSDHEKLSHQRWIERIPTEEPFKAANPRIVRAGEPEFKATSVLFDSLD
jgi:hypothetical protein